MRVLADWHHGGLYYSLYLLFEKRLGWELYRPIGLEWFNKGYWRYSSNLGTVNQYLAPYNPYGDFPGLGDGVVTMDWHEGRQHFPMRGITLDAFSRMDFDYIIPSVNNHERSFELLRRSFHPGAALVRQAGNVHDVIDYGVVRRVLASTSLSAPGDVDVVRYHQEFSQEDYGPTPAPAGSPIKSFLNCHPQTSDYPLWLEVKKRMPETTFKSHGIICDDGNVPNSAMPRCMGSSSFVWHLKSQGDGFGHVIHNAASMGKPLIVKKKYYEGLMGGQLMEDGATCVDLSGDVDHDVRKIRAAAERYDELSDNIRSRFEEVVDFDAEFERIRSFLERAR